MMIHFSEVDECKLYNGGCAQKCVNTEGRHYCECAEGYRLANGTDCQGKIFMILNKRHTNRASGL